MLYWENRDIYLYFSPFFIIYIFLPCIHSLKTYFPHTYFLLETMWDIQVIKLRTMLDAFSLYVKMRRYMYPSG